MTVDSVSFPGQIGVNEGFTQGFISDFEGFCAFFVRFQLCFPLRVKVLIKPSPRKIAQK